MPHPAPDLCFAALTQEEREIVEGWTEELGLEPDQWRHVPPFLGAVEMIAVLRLAADVESAAARDRIRIAAEALGLEDDVTRATHPGDRYNKRLSRWQKRAEDGGHFVESSEDEAA